MTIWLCPECQERLDRRQPISIDMHREHTDKRCAACERRRLTAVPDPEDEPDDD